MLLTQLFFITIELGIHSKQNMMKLLSEKGKSLRFQCGVCPSLSTYNGNVAKQVPEMFINSNGRDVAKARNQRAAFEVLDYSGRPVSV